MISYRRSAFFLPSICLILAGLYCTNNVNSISGGGIDIGNPTVCVVDSLDRPVTDASIKIIPSDFWFANIMSGKSVVAASASTDKSGFAELDSLMKGNCNLQVDHPLGGALVRDFRIADSQKTVFVMIKKYGSISGAISSASGEPAMIRLAGTAYSAPIGATGAYELSNIPEGLCTPMVMAKDSRWTYTHMINVTSSNTTISSNEVSFNTLMIDDFEDSGSTMKMGRFVKGSWIYTAQANNSGTSAQFQIIPEGRTGVSALKGTLIRNNAYALVGFYLGVKPGADSLWDFSSATGLSFYAKGVGKLNVSLESDSIDKMGYYKHYSADIVLQAQWRQFTILFDSLKLYNDANPDPDITWKESARSIKRIEFNALEGDTVQFWLDDLVVNGIDFSAVY